MPNTGDKIYERDVDLWNAQAKNSFVKMKTDWFFDATQKSKDPFNSRILLSFVEHDGKNNGCVQKDFVDIGIPMVTAGSDGKGAGGVSALSLAHLIESNALQRRAAKSREQAAQNGSKYANPVWVCVGGGSSKTGHVDGVAYRRFSISPGVKDGTFVFAASYCEGTRDPKSHGIVPKENATWYNIRVPIDYEYVLVFAKQIEALWTAHLTAIEVKKALATSFVPTSNSEPAREPEQLQPTPAATSDVQTTTTQQQTPKVSYFIFDSCGYFGASIGAAFNAKGAVKVILDALDYMEHEHPWKMVVRDKTELDTLFNNILNDDVKGNHTFNVVPLYSAAGAKDENGNPRETYLAVTVTRTRLRRTKQR